MEHEVHSEFETLDFALGSSRRTTAPKAEEELGALWRATGDEAEARGAGGILRVRELNLVVRAASRAESDRIGQMAGRIAGCHPARVIVVLEEPEARVEELEAWITAACYRSREGDRQVCWEQVNIIAGGAAPAQIQAAVASLLVPDIPVGLWWPGPLDPGHELFSSLASLSDRVIFDSSAVCNLRSDWGEMRTVLRSKGRTWQVADLSWQRLRPWQELVAEPFDRPDRLSFLEEIEEVRVSYEADPDEERSPGQTSSAVARSLLLAGWLGGRLGWMPDGGGWTRDDGGFRAGYRPLRGGRTVDLRLSPVHGSPCFFGGVVEVEMRGRAEVGRPPRSLIVSRREDTCVCATWFWSEGRRDMVRSLEMPIPEQDRLLCEALESSPADQLYEEAFALAAGFAVLPGAELLAE